MAPGLVRLQSVLPLVSLPNYQHWFHLHSPAAVAFLVQLLPCAPPSYRAASLNWVTVSCVLRYSIQGAFFFPISRLVLQFTQIMLVSSQQYRNGRLNLSGKVWQSKCWDAVNVKCAKFQIFLLKQFIKMNKLNSYWLIEVIDEIDGRFC